MRPLAPLVLLALLAAPASGQGEATGSLVFHLDERPLLAPGGDPRETPFSLTVPCAPDGDGAAPIRVEYLVTRAPVWAEMVTSPARDEATACGEDHRATFQGTVRVRAAGDAPAFQAEHVEVEARVAWASGEARAFRGSFPIVATYAPAVDVRPEEPAREAARGARVTFLVDVVNLGNGVTRVDFAVESPTAGIVVAQPRPVTLPWRDPEGGHASTRVLVEAEVARDAEGPQTFTLRYRPAYALDRTYAGEEGRVGFRVDPTGEPPAPARPSPGPPARDPFADSPLWRILREIPGPSPLLALAALGVAALAAGRARGGR